MHITRIRHLFYPDIQPDYFFELSMRQAEAGHEVDVLTWRKNESYSDKVVAGGFIIHRLHGLNFRIDGMIEEYPYLPRLPAKIEMLKSEIVHAESHLFLTTFQAISKAKRLGLPSVVTVHGVLAYRGVAVNSMQHIYLHTLGSEVFKRANRVICLTRSDAGEIIKLGCNPKKIRLVPNAIDTEHFKPSKQQEDNLITWVGRFVPEKGVKYLIEAARIVADEFRDVRFILVGYGPLKTKIMRLAYDRGLLNKFVFFPGALSRDEVAKVLGRSRIFVFPSLKEGLPVSVLEAMASGLSVVGSDIEGVKDIISDQYNGLLVPSRSPKALASAISTLLNDRGLGKKMGKNARQSMIEKYSWDIITSKIEKVYCEAIEEAK